ncbi:Zn(2)-C6 fungal-type domain-containing protein [Mycena kentingensis (nom. inval.)]|nr:Zn(2)-C6 fungal-type domain-containing protein [Mycena kentingensis (nom. inval.)]
MPKGVGGTGGSTRSRGPYASQACTVCRARKSKCDGARPICSPCVAFGRDGECSWGKEASSRRPKTKAHFEALKKLNSALQAYIQVLESRLAKCVCQDTSSSLQMRPPEVDESFGEAASEEAGSEGESEGASELSDEDITKELAIPAQRLKLDDELGGLAVQGSTAPFRFSTHQSRPGTTSPPSIPAREEDARLYVLLVDGVDEAYAYPALDWSRHLPPSVNLSRRDHDTIFDLAFKFWTGWGLRAVPTLLLKDMYRAFSTPASHPPPKTPSYSPMLHNAFLSICAIFSPNPVLRDVATRTRFAEHAKGFLDEECKAPQVSLVHALALLGTFYADIGQRIVADLYVGMSSRVSMTLGLEVDSTTWMESGLITRDEMLARHWTHWAVCFRDVSWALYIGRHFCGPPMDVTRAPPVDDAADAVPWHFAGSSVPSQPNLVTATFREAFALSCIGRKIIDIVNGLDRRQQDTRKLDQLIATIDLELYSWKNDLPAALEITPGNKAKSTPYRLILHCEYWSYFIFLHRPFFSRKSNRGAGDREVDHVKLCKRAAENIVDICETWSKLFSLRYAPAPLFQVIFSAGTIHMLLALQATSSVRIAHVALQTALSKVEQCIQFIRDIGQTWVSGGRVAAVLEGILEDKLRPIVERRLAQKAGGQAPTMVVDMGAGMGTGMEMETPVESKYVPFVEPFASGSASGSGPGPREPPQQQRPQPQPQVQTWYPPSSAYGQGGWSQEYAYSGVGMVMEESMYAQHPHAHAHAQTAAEVDIAAFLPNFDFGAPQYWVRQEPVAVQSRTA